MVPIFRLSMTFSAWMFFRIMSYWWSFASRSLTKSLMSFSLSWSISGSSISTELGMKSKQNPRSSVGSLKLIFASVKLL